jgi:hypothetical protein
VKVFMEVYAKSLGDDLKQKDEDLMHGTCTGSGTYSPHDKR